MIVRIMNMLLVLLILLMLLVCLTISTALADNLGVQGSVYRIAEPDMLTGIHQKLITLQKSGELERQKKAVIARSIAHILRPTPVNGVSDLQKGVSASAHRTCQTAKRIWKKMLIGFTRVFPSNHGNIIRKCIRCWTANQ